MTRPPPPPPGLRTAPKAFNPEIPPSETAVLKGLRLYSLRSQFYSFRFLGNP